MHWIQRNPFWPIIASVEKIGFWSFMCVCLCVLFCFGSFDFVITYIGNMFRKSYLEPQNSRVVIVVLSPLYQATKLMNYGKSYELIAWPGFEFIIVPRNSIWKVPTHKIQHHINPSSLSLSSQFLATPVIKLISPHKIHQRSNEICNHVECDDMCTHTLVN